MSYANATVTNADRAKAATSVIAIHAALGAALVFGLAVTDSLPTVTPPIEAEDVVVELPPPPPEPDTPPEAVPETPTYSPPVAPDMPIVLDRPTVIDVGPMTDRPREVVRVPAPTPVPSSSPGPVASPSPAPSFTPVGPRPANSIHAWITADDYSNADLRREREGTARYRLVIGSDGGVDACELTQSTGHGSLDRATCRLIERRARFEPGTNAQGERVVGTYTGTVTWRIPER